jgi:hypothetical protein
MDEESYALLEPIHCAAYDGALGEINRLVEEDGQRLNALIQGDSIIVGGDSAEGCTPLMLATWQGHDLVVGRLLALGADVGLRDCVEWCAVHWACYRNRASALALLLDDAGALLNARGNNGWTPLIVTTYHGATECVELLLARDGDALELDAVDKDGDTALHLAAWKNHPTIAQLLLQAGADPTVRNRNGRTPLDVAQSRGHQQCKALLQAALAEPQRPRSLLKARALIDTAHKIRQIQLGNWSDEQEQPRRARTRAETKRKALATAPAYLKGRVAKGRQLPAVQVVMNEECQQQPSEEEEELVACLKYALGLEGGGGWHEGEGPAPQQGMLREVFVELCELLVPKWDRANV